MTMSYHEKGVGRGVGGTISYSPLIRSFTIKVHNNLAVIL